MKKVSGKTENVVKKTATPVKSVKKALDGSASKPVAEDTVKTVKSSSKNTDKKASVKKTAEKKTPRKPVAAVSPRTTEKKPFAPIPHPRPDSAEMIRRPDHRIRKLKLSKADKIFFRDLLLKKRVFFAEQLKFHEDAALTARKDAGAERAGMATHMADLGSDNFRHDFELGLLSGEADVMEMIDEALQRIEESEYGICLDCGSVIPKARLEAKPYAKYCTKCKSLRESLEEGSNRRR